MFLGRGNHKDIKYNLTITVIKAIEIRFMLF